MLKRVVVAAIGVAFLSGASLFAQDAKKAADGKKAYDAKGCSVCHLIAGKGSKIAPLDGVGTKLKEADIKKWLTDAAAMEKTLTPAPKIKMSSKKLTLTPTEIDDLVAYLLTLKK